jgi:lysozyme family protein
MQANYKHFVDRMIQRYEGGYGWDRADPGGPTKYGITCYDLAQHRGTKMNSMAGWAPIVKAMPLSEAEDIYETKYATFCHFNELQSGADCVLFDYEVNSGVGRIVPVCRAIVKRPGGAAFDLDLVKAVNAAPVDWFIDQVDAERLAFMRRIRGGRAWAQFGKGWGARVNDLGHYAHALAAGVREPHTTAPDLSNVPTPKANHDDPGIAGKSITGTGGGAGSVIVAGHTAGLPVWAIALAVGGVVVVGVGAAVWSQRRAARLNQHVVLPPGGADVQVVH